MEHNIGRSPAEQPPNAKFIYYLVNQVSEQFSQYNESRFLEPRSRQAGQPAASSMSLHKHNKNFIWKLVKRVRPANRGGQPHINRSQIALFRDRLLVVIVLLNLLVIHNGRYYLS